jgi:hypothetical protein
VSRRPACQELARLRILYQWRGFCIALVAGGWVSDVMDPKLAMLFMLFGSIIGLSYLSSDNVARMKRRMSERRWRKTEPAADEI